MHRIAPRNLENLSGQALTTTGDRRATSDSRIRLSRHGVDDDVELQEYPFIASRKVGVRRGCT